MPENTLLSPSAFYDALASNGVNYFTGIPDSVLAPFISYLENKATRQHHRTANEGNAVGMAAGYYLATSKVPLVYMQNSGIGNALDPLVSLADPTVMNIPMILLIGWRGQPGTKDEPQHMKQGKITEDLLRVLDIPTTTLSRDEAKAEKQVRDATESAKKAEKPVALLVEAGTFATLQGDQQINKYKLSREEAIHALTDSLSDKDVVVATNGKTSRELFEYRTANHQRQRDLLVVGAMGHASSIALAIAENTPERTVYCFDGDGSVIMHMGALATIGTEKPRNFRHIVINNGSHDSTGGQSTVGHSIELIAIAKAAGYAEAYLAQSKDEITRVIQQVATSEGPIFIEIKVRPGARSDLARPTIKPKENKNAFMAFIKE